MTLLIMLGLLVGPFIILTILQKVAPDTHVSNGTKARLGVTFMFFFTGFGHFVQTTAMAKMIPELFSYREQLIFLGGFPELFGALFIWAPKLRKLSGVFLIAMLLGLLPFNIYAAFHHVPFGGHEAGPMYLLVRIPFQFLAMWWVYNASELDWFVLRKEDWQK